MPQQAATVTKAKKLGKTMKGRHGKSFADALRRGKKADDAAQIIPFHRQIFRRTGNPGAVRPGWRVI